jgi:short-subunit dehydrogenase
VLSRSGRIDVLVNNAGVGLLGGAEESSLRQVQAVFDVNLFGAMRITNAVLPAMRKRGEGRIINISSMLGLISAPYSTHYSATKHALEGYSESLDHETRTFNIRVSLIEPGYTRSGFEQNILKPDSVLAEYDQIRTDVSASLKEFMATADLPQVVADAVLRAATDARPRRPSIRACASKSAFRLDPTRARRIARPDQNVRGAQVCRFQFSAAARFDTLVPYARRLNVSLGSRPAQMRRVC